MAGKAAPARKSKSAGRKPFVRASKDLYQEVTDTLVAHLESGALPWRGKRMWQAAGPLAPYNAVSGRSYRGYNLLHLMTVAMQAEGDTFDPRFCTFKQAKEKGWNVKKGAKSVPVFFYKQVTLRGSGDKPQDEASKALAMVRKMQHGGSATIADEAAMDAAERGVAGKKIWILKSFPVFHASQIEGIPELNPGESVWQPDEISTKILNGLRAQGMQFMQGGDTAGYSVARDCLHMPHEASFATGDDYSHVLLHECGHATGHSSRLNRGELGQDRESPAYAQEELVAEMTSAMLCAQVGIASDYTEHATYLQRWLTALRSDKKLLMRAAGAAASAADYLIDLVPDLRASLAQQRKQSADLDEEVDLDGLFGDDSDLPDDVPVMEVAGGEDAPQMAAADDLSDMLEEMGEEFTSIPEPEQGAAQPVETAELSADDPLMAAVDASDWFDEFVEDAPSSAPEPVAAPAVQVKGGLFKKRPVVSM